MAGGELYLAGRALVGTLAVLPVFVQLTEVATSVGVWTLAA